MCPKWRTSFVHFLADMGMRPSTDHTLERRNNNRGYWPDNCYWATRLEQAANKTTTRHVEIGGTIKHVYEWCRQYKIAPPTVYRRVSRGWSFADAITTPVIS